MTLLTICQVQSHREINLKIFTTTAFVIKKRPVRLHETASLSCPHNNLLKIIKNLWKPENLLKTNCN